LPGVQRITSTIMMRRIVDNRPLPLPGPPEPQGARRRRPGRIRADIPGAEGWQPDPVWFREETDDPPFFDPQTYRVSLDGAKYVGLARMWKKAPRVSTGPDGLPRPLRGSVR
jgi:hypothetical protein